MQNTQNIEGQNESTNVVKSKRGRKKLTNEQVQYRIDILGKLTEDLNSIKSDNKDEQKQVRAVESQLSRLLERYEEKLNAKI